MQLVLAICIGIGDRPLSKKTYRALSVCLTDYFGHRNGGQCLKAAP
jgi:hypothetical protein